VLKCGVGLRFGLQETVFDLVKSVEQTQGGFLGNILNYGHLKVATDNVATTAIFKIRYVKNPNEVMNLIQKLIAREQSRL